MKRTGNKSNAHGAGTTTRLDPVIRLLGDVYHWAQLVNADQALICRAIDIPQDFHLHPPLS